MRYFFLLFFFLVLIDNPLYSRSSFFTNRNSLKLGIGKNDFNSVLGTAFQVEYTRYIANAFFASVKFTYADAEDDELNARYASQEMSTTSFNIKINPLVTHQHIISLSLGLAQNNYSSTGNYKKTQPDGTLNYIPYSTSSNGLGYSTGISYDFLFSRSCFLSVSGSVIKYEETVYSVFISIGTTF